VKFILTLVVDLFIKVLSRYGAAGIIITAGGMTDSGTDP
jgi:hypothetical protein